MPLSVNIKRFRPQSAVRRKLPFPATATLRIAQLSTTASFAAVLSFPLERWVELETYRPRVLVGPAADLQRLAERVQLRTIELTSVDHAIFALTECGDKPVTDVFRVTLWQTFGVPVYELFIGNTGNLLASECELHEGWHVEPGAAFSLRNDELIVEAPGRSGIQTGLTGYLDSDLCPCGRSGVRVSSIPGLSHNETSGCPWLRQPKRSFFIPSDPSGAPQSFAGFDASQLTVLKFQLSVDEDIIHAFRNLYGLSVCSGIANRGWIENYNVGEVVSFNRPRSRRRSRCAGNEVILRMACCSGSRCRSRT